MTYSNFILTIYYNFDNILDKVLHVLMIILFAMITYSIVRFILTRLSRMTFKPIKQTDSNKKRKKTLEKITLSLWKYFTYIVTILVIFSSLGIDIQTIVAGAGVLGVIFAVGSQELLSDFFEGLFNVFEDNLSVGDYVTIDNVEGHIVDIGLRTVKIKSFTGEVHIIPNSKIGHFINYSLDNGKALVDIRIDYDVNLYDAIAAINKSLMIIRKSNANILTDPIIQGVNKLDTIGYEIRIICETIKETHWNVQRYMRGELMKTFKENNIKIGVNQIIIKDGNILSNKNS
ncbi:MAG: Small-conductance mechanosensitive channel [Haloplasmataceae bacterium]|nr:Small-conductance mechanosensitive channel [Haloplasmataceae bacterium]